jgi:hypothetical protein
MYKSKLGKMEDGLYIHHQVENPDAEEYKQFQPKQCRTGFYLFENELMEELKVEKSFAIKSAYDKEFRRSKDEQMYGYQSLDVGSSWLFEVTLDDEALEDKIKKALVGEKRVGRSRTAQYGLVKIEEANDYKISVESKTNNKKIALVYADARLIFLDEYGIATFRPTAEDFGFKNGKIDWEKTQIRTFQYAPWNFKRQVRDTDRCGIEKGSIIYIEKKDDAYELIYPEILFVGVYQNEGFGKVIFNPDFLNVRPDSNGKALYKVKTLEEKKRNSDDKKTSTAPLFVYLEQQRKQAQTEQKTLRLVNEFVNNNKNDFTKENFASQWGTIRSIAMTAKSKQTLKDALFDEKEGYLTHGVAKDKWDERGRRGKFKEFIEEKELAKFSDKDFQSAIINLASEMAKISKK